MKSKKFSYSHTLENFNFIQILDKFPKILILV